MRSGFLRVLGFAAASLTVPVSAMAQSCREEAGEEQAKTYVERCLEVSPATHPPCNADNDCQMIIDEIIRGCAFLKEDAPGFCAEYSD